MILKIASQALREVAERSEVGGIRLCFCKASIPQSRYARQPPLHKGASLSLINSSLQTPIYPPKGKQARQKLYFPAFAKLVFFIFA